MFELGEEMVRRGWQVELVTATPKRLVDRTIAGHAHVQLGLATALGAVGRLRRYGLDIPFRFRTALEHRARIQFAESAGRRLGDTGIVDALSGWGLECAQRARRCGIKHVCNRGSTHILWQKAVLEEEFRRWGAPPPQGFPDWGVERELGEYELADAIAVPSRFVKRTFLEHGVPASKLRVCPYGVELSMYSPKPRLDHRFRILFVGLASIRKGIGYLFDAVRPLVQGGHVEFWLIGGIAEDAKKLCARNRDLFSFKGFIPRAHLSEMYSQGSVMALPSVEEGLGLVLAQSMACGVPNIATTNTGAEDLFADGKEGFIVPPRDSSAIRERIEWMLAHPVEREEMGRRARLRVASLGGWQDYGARVEELYSDLLSCPVSLITQPSAAPVV
jgi:glycosyltransferase involved in cell wall biosynthesis